MTLKADTPNIVAIIMPTMISGQPEPVTATAALATSTAALPATLLKEQAHAERMLMSFVRRRQSSMRHAPFARSASRPTSPSRQQLPLGDVGSDFTAVLHTMSLLDRVSRFLAATVVLSVLASPDPAT
jgi:hypothetical protein